MRALILALLCTGCAAYAARDDYAAYRSYRLADTELDELRAMRDYLERFPEGRYAEELQTEYDELESDYYEDSRSTEDGLRRYLEAYPNGTHVAEAQRRLAALTTVEVRRDDAEQERRDRERANRDAALAARRQWADRATAFWSRILLNVDEWDVSMEQIVAANREFNDAFVAEPRPRCSASECVKFYSLDYAIAVRGQTRIERTIRLALRLHLDEGRLVGAELLMPGRGFSRWYELENNTLVADADPESRQGTIEWALDRIIPILRETVPTAVAIDVASEPIEAIGVRDDGEEPAETIANSDALILPLVLQALEQGNVRVVVFAAADEDEGDAFDGFQIRVVRPETEPVEGE